MKIMINGKELHIKFGYKPTLKERIISRVVKLSKFKDDDGTIDMEKMEDLLDFLPEMLLVGLQVHHKEYRYDYDTKAGKQEQLEKMYDLIDKGFSTEESNPIELFNSLQEALTEDSFLASLFRKEQAAQTAEATLITKEATEN